MGPFCNGFKGYVYGTEKFVVEIDVPRISFFSIDKHYSPIKKGTNTLGRISFKNNTQDGFSVTVTSENGGKLVPEESSDGEYNIPYILTLNTIDRVLDDSIVEVLTPELFTNIEVPILYLTGEAGQLSYGHYEVVINIEDVHNALEMAGKYEDTLTIKYSDL